MQTKVKKTKKKISNYGNEVRRVCADLLRAKVPTGEEQEELAHSLGISLSYVQSMIYKNHGGLDAYAAALAVVYELNDKKIKKLFGAYSQILRKSNQSISDKMWERISRKLSENRRVYWLSILEAAIDAERKFIQSNKK